MGRYSLCSKITSLIGIMLDSGMRERKKKNIPNETRRYFGKMRIAAARMNMMAVRLNRTAGSNSVLEMR